MNQHQPPARESDPFHALAQHLSKSAAELAAQSQLFQDLADQRDHELDSVRQTLETLQTTVAGLDDRLSGVLRQFQESRHDVTSEAEARHHDLAQSFQHLIDQKVFPLCALVTQNSTSKDRSRREGRYLNLALQLCRQLFGPLPPLRPKVQALFQSYGAEAEGVNASWDAQIYQLHQRICSLRLQVAAVGTPFRWDFDVSVGERYTESHYRLWTTALPDAEVNFAVAPAYCVPGRQPYVPAVVFTAFPPDPRGS